MFSDERNEWLEGIGFVSTVMMTCSLLVGLFVWGCSRVSDSELFILKKDISAQERRMDGLEESLILLRNQIDNQKEKR